MVNILPVGWGEGVGGFLKGIAFSTNPTLANVLLAQNKATAGTGTLNNMGTSAAQVANAGNGLAGLKLFSPAEADAIRAADTTVGGTEAVPLAKGGLVEIPTEAGAGATGFNLTPVEAGIIAAPAVLNAIKSGLEKDKYIDMWGSGRGSSVRLPSYVLGR